jgi:hypothetical protein
MENKVMRITLTDRFFISYVITNLLFVIPFIDSLQFLVI